MTRASARLVTPLVVNFAAAATALAGTLKESAFLARRGSLGMRESAFLTPDEESVTACALPTMDPCLVGPRRFFVLFDLALKELKEECGDLLAPLEVSFWVLLDDAFGYELSPGRTRAQTIGEELESRLTTALGISNAKGSRSRLHVRTEGATAFSEILPEIAHSLAKDGSDVAIVLGLHSDLDPTRIEELHRTHRLWGEEQRDGIIPGEAASIVILSTEPSARRLKLPNQATLKSALRAIDAARPDNDESAFAAKAMTYCVHRVITESTESGRERIGWVMADVGFEALRLSEYQAILARNQERFGPPQVHEFPTQRFGSLGAATELLHLGLAAVAWRYGFAPAKMLLSTAGGDDGSRACFLATGP